MSDPYIDPQSGIPRNKFGLTNQESQKPTQCQHVQFCFSLTRCGGVGHGSPNVLRILRSTSACVPISWLLLPVNSTFREKRCYPWRETLVCLA